MATAWPLRAGAQQDGRVRRIGWLIGGDENNLPSRANGAALQEALAKLGWIEGRNLRIDLRIGVGDPDRLRTYAAELVGLAPDMILANGGAATSALRQQTQTIPRIYPTVAQDLFLVKDLYLVYEGVNQDTGKPIIKAHLNPMVPYIWLGLVLMIFGTITALVPNAAPLRVSAPARVQPATVGAGD